MYACQIVALYNGVAILSRRRVTILESVLLRSSCCLNAPVSLNVSFTESDISVTQHICFSKQPEDDEGEAFQIGVRCYIDLPLVLDSKRIKRPQMIQH